MNNNPYDAISSPPIIPNPIGSDVIHGLQQRPPEYSIRSITPTTTTTTPPTTHPIGNSTTTIASAVDGGGGFHNPIAVEAAYRPANIINLSHSNDVVIGPMTQYQGAVTIYQYMDATVESTVRSPPGSLGLKSSNSTNDKCFNLFKHGIHVWILLLIFVTIATGICVAIYLQYFRSNNNDNMQTNVHKLPREILFGNEYEDETIPNLGHGHLVIDRRQWGAAALSSNAILYDLKQPISYVMITHIGVQSKPCNNVYNCSIKMRTIQDSAIAEAKESDIKANFYISDDGYIYVGRGWNIANAYSNVSLAICFMGDYIRYQPSQRQFDGVHHLLAHGVAKQYLSPNYKLIAHNQTKTTRSPGTNVYKEIIKWPHWYPCGMNKNPPCDV